MIGTIKVLKNGFGFIKSEDTAEDVFFHLSNLEGVEFDELEVENEVEFEVGEGKNGKDQALNIKLTA